MFSEHEYRAELGRVFTEVGRVFAEMGHARCRACCAGQRSDMVACHEVTCPIWPHSPAAREALERLSEGDA